MRRLAPAAASTAAAAVDTFSACASCCTHGGGDVGGIQGAINGSSADWASLSAAAAPTGPGAGTISEGGTGPDGNGAMGKDAVPNANVHALSSSAEMYARLALLAASAVVMSAAEAALSTVGAGRGAKPGVLLAYGHVYVGLFSACACMGEWKQTYWHELPSVDDQHVLCLQCCVLHAPGRNWHVCARAGRSQQVCPCPYRCV